MSKETLEVNVHARAEVVPEGRLQIAPELSDSEHHVDRLSTVTRPILLSVDANVLGQGL